MNKSRAKAISLTVLDRKNSPPGLLDRQIKRLMSKPENITKRLIRDSLSRLFWQPPEIYAPPTCAFSHELYSEYSARERKRLERKRLALAVHVIRQTALLCLPHAKVNYDEYEKAFRERALYFRPMQEFVVVDFPVTCTASPDELEDEFRLPEGDAKQVLSVLEFYCATAWHVSFIQIEGLTSPCGPRGPLEWPEPPFQIRPARLAHHFVKLVLGDVGRTGSYRGSFLQQALRRIARAYEPPRV